MKMNFLLVSLVFLFASSNVVFPDEVKKHSQEVAAVNPDDELLYNLSFGVSPFECMLGIELLKGAHSIGLGGCGQLSYRYYSNPYGDSQLYGIYAGYSSGYQRDESKKEIDGVLYEERESVYAGVGAGYRWQWLSGWNVTTSLAIHFMNDEFSNPGEPKKREKSEILFPGITAGYKF
jgi:hypothetical protein